MHLCVGVPVTLWDVCTYNAEWNGRHSSWQFCKTFEFLSREMLLFIVEYISTRTWRVVQRQFWGSEKRTHISYVMSNSSLKKCWNNSVKQLSCLHITFVFRLTLCNIKVHSLIFTNPESSPVFAVFHPNWLINLLSLVFTSQPFITRWCG
jgi:hypothetical protein